MVKGLPRTARDGGATPHPTPGPAPVPGPTRATAASLHGTARGTGGPILRPRGGGANARPPLLGTTFWLG